MKIRKLRKDEDEVNYWPSFVDVMSTISLVFFFIMIISIAITYTKYREIRSTYDQIDNIGEERKKLYEKIEKTLKPKLGDNVSFVDGKLEIKTEVLFEFGKADLTPKGKEIARQISEAFYELMKDPLYREKIQSVEIRGHTDNVGLGTTNRFLSTNRAGSFLNEMIPDGSQYEEIAYKFKASGMSKFVPKENGGTVQDQTPEQASQNRRIEIYINMSEDDIVNAINKLINSNKK